MLLNEAMLIRAGRLRLVSLNVNYRRRVYDQCDTASTSVLKQRSSTACFKLAKGKLSEALIVTGPLNFSAAAPKITRVQLLQVLGSIGIGRSRDHLKRLGCKVNDRRARMRRLNVPS